MYTKKIKYVIRLAQDLIRINSENPNSTELKVQEFLVEILSTYGFEIELIEYDSDRNNVIGLYPPLSHAGEFDYKYVAFSGHMDTVPGYSQSRSDLAPIEDNKLYGRGSSDMKGGIASFLIAIGEFIKEYKENKSKYKIKRGICVILSVDEEMGGEGLKYLNKSTDFNKNYRIDLCILAEPTYLHPVIGHKGIIWFILDFIGISAHASTPAKGSNAIYKAAKFIEGLQKLKEQLKGRFFPDIADITPPTLNVGIIQGGVKTNIVPDFCHLQIDRRLIPNETPELALEEIKNIASELDLLDDMNIHPIKPGESYFLPDGISNPYFKELDQISKSYRNERGQLFLDGYTEADIFYRYYQIPVIILGPGSLQQAHKNDEFVEITQLEGAYKIYYSILERFCI